MEFPVGTTRVRPKMMTVVAIMAGLVPILWSTGTGSEVMRRIAVPMVGGMVSSTLLTLLVIPAIFAIVKGWRLPQESAAPVAFHERAASPAESISCGSVSGASIDVRSRNRTEFSACLPDDLPAAANAEG